MSPNSASASPEAAAFLTRLSPNSSSSSPFPPAPFRDGVVGRARGGMAAAAACDGRGDTPCLSSALFGGFHFLCNKTFLTGPKAGWGIPIQQIKEKKGNSRLGSTEIHLISQEVQPKLERRSGRRSSSSSRPEQALSPLVGSPHVRRGGQIRRVQRQALPVDGLLQRGLWARAHGSGQAAGRTVPGNILEARAVPCGGPGQQPRRRARSNALDRQLVPIAAPFPEAARRRGEQRCCGEDS